MHLLLIEDNKTLCQTLARHIKKAGYTLDYTYDGLEGLYYIEHQKYDVVILDCMLPSLTGIDLLKRIRSQGNQTSVIITTALCDVTDRVNGLDAGADDYLTKPFAIEELLARIRALRRRPVKLENTNTLTFGDLHYDCDQKILTGPLHQCPLSKKEAQLMEFLMANPKLTLSRETIFSRIWGLTTDVESSNLDNYIRFIRRRLKTVGSTVQLSTVRSVGYVLEEAHA